MSHIVTVEVRVRDLQSLQAACRRLELPQPVPGRHQLFSATVEGLAVRLPQWRFPVVFNTSIGNVAFDDYGGRWGDRRHLDALLQGYAVEHATTQARRQGFTVLEQPLEDGSIRLSLLQGGLT